MPTETWTHPRHPWIEARRGVSSSRPSLRAGFCQAEIIAGRFCDGEEILDLACDYGVPRAYIEAALRFELDASAKRAWRKWYREVGR